MSFGFTSFTNQENTNEQWGLNHPEEVARLLCCIEENSALPLFQIVPKCLYYETNSLVKTPFAVG